MRLLTFNCSALPLLTPRVSERMALITAGIRALDPDIACLQEVGLERHAASLATSLAGWPHAWWQRRPLGLIAGGLVLFAKRPFVRARFTAFREQGPWLGHSYLARLSRKGFMVVDWEEPALRLVHTHPLADYGASLRVRTDYAALQQRQYAQLIEELRRGLSAVGVGRPFLALAGDLNIVPESPLYRNLVSELALTDLMAGSREPSMVAEECFKAFPGVPKRPARLDYILVSCDGGIRDGRAFFAMDRPLEFADGGQGTLSDHRGVVGEFFP